MRKFILQLCVILLIFLLDSCSNPHKNREKANNLERQGLYREAITYLDKAIEEDPLFIDAYMDRGVDKAFLGMYRDAIYDYSIVLDIDSINILAYFNRAKNYARIDSLKLAYNDITKSYYLTTKNDLKLDSIQLHIRSIYEEGKYDVPLHEILFERGLIFLEMDSLEKAYSDINNCIDDIDLSAQAYYWRGVINLKLGYRSEACDDLNNAYSLGEFDAKKEIEKYCECKDKK